MNVLVPRKSGVYRDPIWLWSKCWGAVAERSPGGGQHAGVGLWLSAMKLGVGEPRSLKGGGGEVASCLYSREPNLSSGVSELPVVELGFGSWKCWEVYAEGWLWGHGCGMSGWAWLLPQPWKRQGCPFPEQHRGIISRRRSCVSECFWMIISLNLQLWKESVCPIQTETTF